MNNKFDELAKGLAQSVTRREMFRKLGGVIVGTFTVWLGLDRVSAASGNTIKGVCQVQPNLACGDCWYYSGICIDPTTCQAGYSSQCGGKANKVSMACGQVWVGSKGCSF